MPPSHLTGLANATRHLLGVVVLAIVAGLLVAGLAIPVVAGGSIAAKRTVDAFTALPADFEVEAQAERSTIRDAKGRTLAIFYDENRIYVPLERIAPVMRNAILAVEDARFYEHGPIDLQGTARALITNVSSGGIEGGGSTLTQQWVKNVLVTQADSEEEIAQATEVSYGRKLRELRLAMAAEELFTKDQILERYLNIAYFGGGAYGVEAAARHYFSTNANSLTLVQAATLAGLVQSPSAYDPERFPDRAVGRRNVVLDRMQTVGMITAERAEQAKQRPLRLDVTLTPNGCAASYAPFFCDYVLRELLDWKGLGATPEERERTLRRGGLTITTTLDPNEQRDAVAAVRAYAAPRDQAAAALAVVEPGTGKITAMAQSRKYGRGPGRTFINYATDEDRGGSRGFQVGSTMKVFVLAAAIQQGIPLTTRIQSPQERVFEISDFSTCDGVAGFGPYPVKNSTGAGTFDLRTGTWRSVNTFFVELERRTGLCDPVRLATQSGLTYANGQPFDQFASFVLGSGEVSPLSVAEAYAVFAARGTHCNSIAVTSIIRPNGNKIKVPPANCTQVLERPVADAVNQVLEGVIGGPDPGRTGQRMALSRPAAGKTGTTDNTRAVWFTGYIPQRAASAVVVYPNTPNRSLIGVRLNGVTYYDVCGGCIPGPIWKRYMDAAAPRLPVKEFADPDPTTIAGVEATVPNVYGYGSGTAIATLRAAGFEAYIGGSVNSTLPRGVVVSTTPGGGATYPSGASVAVYTSTGYVPPPKKDKPKKDPRNRGGNQRGQDRQDRQDRN